jgi:hypothetical protein
MAKPADIVQAFMGTMGKGDFVAARKYLDDNLSFQCESGICSRVVQTSTHL